MRRWAGGWRGQKCIGIEEFLGAVNNVFQPILNISWHAIANSQLIFDNFRQKSSFFNQSKKKKSCTLMKAIPSSFIKVSTFVSAVNFLLSMLRSVNRVC